MLEIKFTLVRNCFVIMSQCKAGVVLLQDEAAQIILDKTNPQFMRKCRKMHCIFNSHGIGAKYMAINTCLIHLRVREW